uniref:Uncharacterized protein n=1 Tax=Tenebrio molitor TaxID=7067 RepID=A0A8J6LB76_TENMO|nr:hypothetical protein GEV33_015380 [Tenebrio molitor]
MLPLLGTQGRGWLRELNKSKRQIGKGGKVHRGTIYSGMQPGSEARNFFELPKALLRGARGNNVRLLGGRRVLRDAIPDVTPEDRAVCPSAAAALPFLAALPPRAGEKFFSAGSTNLSINRYKPLGRILQETPLKRAARSHVCRTLKTENEPASASFQSAFTRADGGTAEFSAGGGGRRFFLHAVLAALPPSSSINTQLASSNFTLSDLVYDVRAVHPVITAYIINTTPILSPPPPPENQAPEDALFVISSAIDYRRIHSIINPRTVPGSASRGRPIGPMHYAWSAPAAAGLFSESENANVRAVTLTGEGPERSPEGRRYHPGKS